MRGRAANSARDIQGVRRLGRGVLNSVASTCGRLHRSAEVSRKVLKAFSRCFR